MATSQKTYSLTQKPQLIDLNGESVNFDLSFSATNTKGQNFWAVVVDQTQLDSGDEPQYRETEKGTISANIVSDQGIYQSYYLMLKSEKPCQVLVTITKNEKPNSTPPIEPDPEPEQPQQKKQQKQQQKQQNQQKTGWKKYLVPGLVALGIAAGAAVVYFTMFRGKKNSTVLPLHADPVPELPNNTRQVNELLLSKLNRMLPK